MQVALYCAAVVTCCYLVLTALETLIGSRQLTNLRQQPLPEAPLPSISIIFSALNEEEKIETALLSLLRVNYPHLEIIAVDDRSTDHTFKKMQELKRRFPQLQIYQIQTLPEKWFGKNHALHFAAQHAKGDWLLFTDADVMMKPDLLLKAMSYSLSSHIDHLTIYEYHPPSTFLKQVFLFGLYLSYSVFYKPWRVRYAWSSRACGHGAFNLVNKKVYTECGGHQAIAMECLDDMKLGELIKVKGYQQDTVDGRDYLEREWYSSFSATLSGMKKNAAAFGDYHVLPVLLGTIFFFFCFIFPVIAVWFTSGITFWLNFISVVSLLGIAFCVAKQFRIQTWYAFLFPLSIFFVAYSVWNSLINVRRANGVIWRGTLYPLDVIRSRHTISLPAKKWSDFCNWLSLPIRTYSNRHANK